MRILRIGERNLNILAFCLLESLDRRFIGDLKEVHRRFIKDL